MVNSAVQSAMAKLPVPASVASVGPGLIELEGKLKQIEANLKAAQAAPVVVSTTDPKTAEALALMQQQLGNQQNLLVGLASSNDELKAKLAAAEAALAAAKAAGPVVQMVPTPIDGPAVGKWLLTLSDADQAKAIKAVYEALPEAKRESSLSEIKDSLAKAGFIKNSGWWDILSVHTNLRRVTSGNTAALIGGAVGLAIVAAGIGVGIYMLYAWWKTRAGV
jgi:hypothetical protein